jgi:GNAT superfamily N-acetyltransferase
MAIYEEAIPKSERKSAAQVAAMLRSPDYRCLGAFLAGRLIGFALAYRFRGERLALLEYMAVDPSHRSEGVGGQLFQAVLALFDAATPLLLEVESDREPSEDQAQRAQRKRFYARLGCREIEGLTYVLPIGEHPPAMSLLVHGAAALDRATVSRWLILLYVEVYGCAESDPRIARMAASLETRASGEVQS